MNLEIALLMSCKGMMTRKILTKKNTIVLNSTNTSTAALQEDEGFTTYGGNNIVQSGFFKGLDTLAIYISYIDTGHGVTQSESILGTRKQ